MNKTENANLEKNKFDPPQVKWSVEEGSNFGASLLVNAIFGLADEAEFMEPDELVQKKWEIIEDSIAQCFNTITGVTLNCKPFKKRLDRIVSMMQADYALCPNGSTVSNALCYCLSSYKYGENSAFIYFVSILAGNQKLQKKMKSITVEAKHLATAIWITALSDEQMFDLCDIPDGNTFNFKNFFYPLSENPERCLFAQQTAVVLAVLDTSSGGTTGAGADEDQGGQAALTINPGGMKVYINVEPGTTWRQFLTGIKPTPENFFTGKEADFDSERDHVGDQVGMALNNVLNAAAKARGYSKYEDLLDVFTYESKNSSEPFQNLAEAIVWCMTVATYESACSDADGYLACEFALLGGEISEAMASPASSARRAYVQLVGNGSGSGPVRIDDKIKAGALYTLYGSDDLSTLDSQTGYENFSLTMEDGTLGPYTLFNTLFSDASYCARKGASFNSNVYNIFDGITKTIFMRLAHQEYNNFITMETTSDGVVVRLTPAGAHALTILLGKQSTDVQNMVDAGSELTGMEIYIKKTGNNSGTITRVSTHLRTSAIQQSKFEEMKQGFETGEDANKVSDVFGSIDNYLLALLNATLFAEDIDENDPTFPTDGKEQIKWIKAFFADSTLELVENSAVYRKLEWT